MPRRPDKDNRRGQSAVGVSMERDFAVACCESPLKRKSPPQDDPQGGLWDWQA
jgi:hypothetical protein